MMFKEYVFKILFSLITAFICLKLKRKAIVYLTSISGGFIVCFFASYLINFVGNPMD